MFPPIGSTMNNRIVIHIVEFVLACIFIVVKWPIYEGSEFDYGAFLCFEYLFIIATFCFIGSLWSTMRKACDVSDDSKQQWWRILLSNAPWCVLTLVILLLFSSSLGYSACLPIVIPNSIYLLYLLIRRLLNNRKDENETSQ